MASPFPGMDPYLEPHWLDIHTALVSEARRQLNQLLPPGIVARAEERVAVESDGGWTHRVGPDIRVFSPSSADPGEGNGGIAIEAPFKLVVELDPVIERFIRIIDEAGQLITVVEFLSPTNKRQPGLNRYHEKREELLAASVHVVEVDLVRVGDWRAVMRPQLCPPQAVSIYRAVVRTAGVRSAAYLFPISLREPLPEVPIPLRPGDRPVKLPVQSMIEAVYADGRYGSTIRYDRDLDPPLESDDAQWTRERIASASPR